MSKVLTLKFRLLSAATFGRGEGLPGLVDQEVEHDAYGLPYMRGRTLRGLLAEEMEGLLFALVDPRQQAAPWQTVRDRLLGTSGAFLDESGILHVGDARLPENVRQLIAASVEAEARRDNKGGVITPSAVLESLTAIRRQTAMTPYGAPDSGTLRAMRVVLRETSFEAMLTFDVEPDERDLALLTATVLAWRRAGTGRNRGRGRLRAWLKDEAFAKRYFEAFRKAVQQS